MIPASRVARAALRAPNVRACGFRYQQLRFESSANPSAAGAGGSRASNSYLLAGVAGGFIGAGLFYAVYSFTPAGRAASKINKAAKDANEKYQQLVKQLQQNAPDSDQAVDAVRKFAYSYVAWIPGGRAYVDAAFKDWDTIRSNHREEADKIVKETYKQLQDISKAGLNYDTASKAYDILADFSKKITDLAGSAMSDLIENHPQVKEKLGGNVDQLKRMGQRYGPDAQKQIDATWAQVKDIFASGISASNLEKARKLIQDKVKELSKLGDKAWNKALEEAKPYLDKNPKIKELIEKNADALKQGNIQELIEKVRSAVDSGKLENLQDYVSKVANEAKSKASSSGSDSESSGWEGLSQYIKMIPQGDEVLSKLQRLSQVADKHKDEGEKLFRETLNDIKELLEKKAEKAQKIVEGAKKDS